MSRFLRFGWCSAGTRAHDRSGTPHEGGGGVRRHALRTEDHLHALRHVHARTDLSDCVPHSAVLRQTSTPRRSPSCCKSSRRPTRVVDAPTAHRVARTSGTTFLRTTTHCANSVRRRHATGTVPANMPSQRTTTLPRFARSDARRLTPGRWTDGTESMSARVFANDGGPLIALDAGDATLWEGGEDPDENSDYGRACEAGYPASLVRLTTNAAVIIWRAGRAWNSLVASFARRASLPGRVCLR